MTPIRLLLAYTVATAPLGLWSPQTFIAAEIRSEPSTYFLPTNPIYVHHDYSGILIDLQLDDLVNLTTQSLLYADQYFNNWEKTPQTDLKSWARSGHLRGLLHDKQNSVKQKLTSLERNIAVNPIPAHISPSSDSSRPRRSIDIAINLANNVSSFFVGVSSIFHMASISAIQKSVNNFAYHHQKLENFTAVFAGKVNSVTQKLAGTIDLVEEQSRVAMSLFIVLDMADSQLDLILASLTPLVIGVIPTYLLDPSTCHQAFDAATKDAASRGMAPVINDPGELLSLDTTTFAANGSWFLLLHLPIVAPKEALTAFTFYNFPIAVDSRTVAFDSPPSVFAFQPGLYPDINHVVIDLLDYRTQCTVCLNRESCIDRKMANFYI